MNSSICKFYWDSVPAHIFFNLILGPLLGLILVYLFRSKLKIRFWIKALALYLAMTLGSCAALMNEQQRCETVLFGDYRSTEVVGSTDAISFVEFILFVPAFIIIFFIALWLLRRIKRSISQPN